MPTEKLSKILRLESEKHDNHAVYGGLASYADTWLAEASTNYGPEHNEWIQEVAERLRSYGGLSSPAQRAEAIAALQAMLQPSGHDPQQESDSTEESRNPEDHSAPESKRPRRVAAHALTGLDSSIEVLQGVGPKQAGRLARLGIRSIRDLLYFFPRRYDDYSQLKTINRLQYGEDVTIIAQVRVVSTRKTRRGKPLFKAVLSDGTGSVEATWFNQPYLGDRIKRGRQVVISGKVDQYLGRLTFTSPEWEPLE